MRTELTARESTPSSFTSVNASPTAASPFFQCRQLADQSDLKRFDVGFGTSDSRFAPVRQVARTPAIEQVSRAWIRG